MPFGGTPRAFSRTRLSAILVRPTGSNLHSGRTEAPRDRRPAKEAARPGAPAAAGRPEAAGAAASRDDRGFDGRDRRKDGARPPREEPRRAEREERRAEREERPPRPDRESLGKKPAGPPAGGAKAAEGSERRKESAGDGKDRKPAAAAAAAAADKEKDKDKGDKDKGDKEATPSPRREREAKSATARSAKSQPVPPSSKVHVSRLPPDCTEAEVRSAFGALEVRSVSFDPSHRWCHVEFKDVATAESVLAKKTVRSPAIRAKSGAPTTRLMQARAGFSGGSAAGHHSQHGSRHQGVPPLGRCQQGWRRRARTRKGCGTRQGRGTRREGHGTRREGRTRQGGGRDGPRGGGGRTGIVSDGLCRREIDFDVFAVAPKKVQLKQVVYSDQQE